MFVLYSLIEMAENYQKKEIGGQGEILGNKFDVNYKGSNKCPDGYTWVNSYKARKGMFGKAYVAGHCRKISDGPEVEDRAGGLF
jgi:hypothetical protein